MIDVSEKSITLRYARAQTVIYLPQEVVNLVSGSEIISKKGPVFQCAKIAGIMAAKQTSSLIPFCHPLLLEDIQVNIVLSSFPRRWESSVSVIGLDPRLRGDDGGGENDASDESQVALIDCEIKTHGKTGVEMEALVGSSIAALTIYDMCKYVSHYIVIESTRLIEKTGGKSDVYA